MTFMVNYKFISYQWQIRVATGQFGSVREIFQSKTIISTSLGWFGSYKILLITPTKPTRCHLGLFGSGGQV